MIWGHKCISYALSDVERNYVYPENERQAHLFTAKNLIADYNVAHYY